MTVKNKVQLITYPDSLGGDLKTLDNGEYTIKITSTLGNVETVFTVSNSKDDNSKPDTGKDDNSSQKPTEIDT